MNKTENDYCPAKIITSRRMEFHKDIGGKKTTKNELSTDSRFS
jgi:hypothetical protein